LPDDRQHTNRVPHREQVQTARQAAEALFRPKRQPASIEETTDPRGTPSSSTKRDTPRAPRILSATPATSISADQPQMHISSAPTQRRTDTRKARKIPASAHGRIKALATYGMSVEDVAGLYGVPASEIARIVSP
jgi:hypothetical protein